MNFEYKPKLGKISYTNVEPIYYSIKENEKYDDFTLIAEPPAVLNDMMNRGALDLGPVSSFAYAANHRNWFIIPNLSVSCFNDVMSVILASNHKIEDLNDKKVAFSRDSASAVNLCRILFNSYNVKPEIETVQIQSVETMHLNYDATLVIGDNALSGRWKNYRYIYDLGELWCKKRGIPFVFALWVIRKDFALKNRDLAKKVINNLYESKNEGLQNLDIISKGVSEKLGIDLEISSNYFKKLNFNLDEPQIKGLSQYYRELFENSIIKEEAELNFFE